jgi:phage terminase Nu1 subunit (DNA packaging protein)
MPDLPEMNEEERKRSQQMFGCEIEQYMASVKSSITYKLSGPGMVVASILSDVQEMVERDMKEEVRQHLNIAKYLIFNSTISLNE